MKVKVRRAKDEVWLVDHSNQIGPEKELVLACSFLAKRIEVAKLYYFDSDDDRLFRRIALHRPPSGTVP